MLAEDAEVHSDGGGKVSAARVVIRGRDRVARFLAGVFRKKRVTARCRRGDGQRRAGAGVPVRRRGRFGRGRCASRAACGPCT